MKRIRWRIWFGVMSRFDVSIRRKRKRDCGFSRMELMVVLCGLALLALVVLPVLAAADPKADREACMNNLRRVGQAFAAFAQDHQGLTPWRVAPKDGGTQGMRSGGNAWVQFQSLSNHLDSPTALACPGDKVKVATSWGRDPQGGFLHPSFRANGLSYFVGLDAQAEAGRSILSGDHNLDALADHQTCDYAKIDVAVSLYSDKAAARWNGQVHGEPGNILFQDGQVQALTSPQLRVVLGKTKAVHPENHALMPR